MDKVESIVDKIFDFLAYIPATLFYIITKLSTAIWPILKIGFLYIGMIIGSLIGIVILIFVIVFIVKHCKECVGPCLQYILEKFENRRSEYSSDVEEATQSTNKPSSRVCTRVVCTLSNG